MQLLLDRSEKAVQVDMQEAEPVLGEQGMFGGGLGRMRHAARAIIFAFCLLKSVARA